MQFTRVMLNLTLALIMAFTLQNRVCAQAGEGLQELFNRAVVAEGSEYAEIRDAIVAHRAEAVPLLKEKCADRDRTQRVLAAAMLSWINEPEKNKRREELVHSVLLIPVRPRTGMLGHVRTAALGPFVESTIPGFGEGSREDPVLDWVRRRKWGRKGPGFEDELCEASAVPFLLEIVLKGTIHPPRPEGAEKYVYGLKRPTESQVLHIAKDPRYVLWAQWYATAYVGGLQGADIVPVLTDLLQSGKSWELRTCAAAGLRKTRNPHAVEPLIAALTDKEGDVRSEARRALVKITGQDYGLQDIEQQQEKYRAWWQENKERLLKEKWKE